MFKYIKLTQNWKAPGKTARSMAYLYKLFKIISSFKVNGKMVQFSLAVIKKLIIMANHIRVNGSMENTMAQVN